MSTLPLSALFDREERGFLSRDLLVSLRRGDRPVAPTWHERPDIHPMCSFILTIHPRLFIVQL